MKMTMAVLALAALAPLGMWAQDGKAIYLDQCAVCHGEDGAGKTAKGKKLKLKGVKETAAKMKEDEMIKIVHDGKGADMAAFGKQLKDPEIKAVVGYYRGLAK